MARPLSPGGSILISRRETTRYTLENAIVIVVTKDGRALRRKIVNISMGGMRLECPQPLPIGSRLQLSHPEAGHFDAEVRWCRGRQMGVALRASDAEREAIVESIRSSIESKTLAEAV